MLTSIRRFSVLAGAALLVAGLLATSSYAYPPRTLGGARVLPNSQLLVNPAYQIAPGLSLNQYAYNVRVLGRAYSQVPPWVYGYNPYPQTINYGPVYPYYSPPPSYYNPYAYYGGVYNPYGGVVPPYSSLYP